MTEVAKPPADIPGSESSEIVDQININDIKLAADLTKGENHKISCPNVGELNVFVQGQRSSSEVVILTVHDLGCNHEMYHDFVSHPKMHGIRHRTVWLHVDVPGQEHEAPDLPAGYVFPTMATLGADLIHILDALKVKEVVCFGEGAGANILARFAIAHLDRVLGICLLHCTGTTAGFMESIKDKLINRRLSNDGMNPSAENYLLLHRFGAATSKSSQTDDGDLLKNAIESYQSNLRTQINPKNLKNFVEAFLKRTNIHDNIKKVTCPILFITGSRSVFNGTTRALHQSMMKTAPAQNKGKIEFLEVAGCANVLEEKPEKLVESFQYFLQGLGLVSSVPMHHVGRPLRMRSMSMEEYDMPKLRNRSMSGGSTDTSSTPAQSEPASVAN